jgi:hypothetical protein
MEVPSKEIEGTFKREGRGYKNGRGMINNKRNKEEEATMQIMIRGMRKNVEVVSEIKGEVFGWTLL